MKKERILGQIRDLIIDLESLSKIDRGQEFLIILTEKEAEGTVMKTIVNKVLTAMTIEIIIEETNLERKS